MLPDCSVKEADVLLRLIHSGQARVEEERGLERLLELTRILRLKSLSVTKETGEEESFGVEEVDTLELVVEKVEEEEDGSSVVRRSRRKRKKSEFSSFYVFFALNVFFLSFA